MLHIEAGDLALYGLLNGAQTRIYSVTTEHPIHSQNISSRDTVRTKDIDASRLISEFILSFRKLCVNASEVALLYCFQSELRLR